MFVLIGLLYREFAVSSLLLHVDFFFIRSRGSQNPVLRGAAHAGI
jgi:hypothetical protein